MQDFTVEEYKRVNTEVSNLKDQLREITQKKEYWFHRKEDLKKDINSLITKIKEIRSHNDTKKAEIQELKAQRDKYNSTVKELISKIKDLNEEKAKVFKEYNIKIDPLKIQEKINELEKKVEIEPNFEKEKKLMEEIKKLKRVYGETSVVLKIAGETSNLYREIRAARKKANEFHRQVQESARDSSYFIFAELSKKITETKTLQEQAFQTFIDYKNKYGKNNLELSKRLETLDMIGRVLNKNKEVKKMHEIEKNNKILKEKTKVVEEKLKTKKMLTTEDLIVLQGKEFVEDS